MKELIEELQELDPKQTLQAQSQSILEIRYKFSDLCKPMQDQPDNPELHWLEINGKRFLYTQTVQEVLSSLTEG